MSKAVVIKRTNRGKVHMVFGKHKALRGRCSTAGLAVVVGMMGFDRHSQLLTIIGCESARPGCQCCSQAGRFLQDLATMTHSVIGSRPQQTAFKQC